MASTVARQEKQAGTKKQTLHLFSSTFSDLWDGEVTRVCFCSVVTPFSTLKGCVTISTFRWWEGESQAFLWEGIRRQEGLQWWDVRKSVENWEDSAELTHL